MIMANERKMTLHPKASSVDIDELIANAGGGLPDEVSETIQPRERKSKSVSRAPRETPKRPIKRVGRPPKVKEDKRGQKVTLSLTDAERQKLKEKSGMAAEATYLLSILRQAGVFD